MSDRNCQLVALEAKSALQVKYVKNTKERLFSSTTTAGTLQQKISKILSGGYYIHGLKNITPGGFIQTGSNTFHNQRCETGMERKAQGK